MRRCAVLVLTVLIMSCLAGCGSSSGNDDSYGQLLAYDVAAETHILSMTDLAVRDGLPVQEETEIETVPADIPEIEAVIETVTETMTESGNTEEEDTDTGDNGISSESAGFVFSNPAGFEEVVPSGSRTSSSDSGTRDTEMRTKKNYGYRYQDYVLTRAGDFNAVFSGEAFLTQLSMWAECLDDESAQKLESYIGRDYLSFRQSGDIMLAKAVWADRNVSFDESLGITEYLNVVDMSAPSATSEKNAAVSLLTDGYISYTPSVFSADTKADFICIPMLNAEWKDGAKPYDTKSRLFYNADGTESRTVMLHDEGLTYWAADNAMAYCMYLQDGSYVMFILPNDGVSVKDVDVAQVMNGSLASKRAHVNFYVPEFSVESDYALKLSDFGQDDGLPDSGKVSGLTGYSPVFYQSVRFSVSSAGVGNVTDDLVVLPGTFDPDLDTVNIICNRPFMYYVGDSVNEDVVFFGIVNHADDMVAVNDDDNDEYEDE